MQYKSVNIKFYMVPKLHDLYSQWHSRPRLDIKFTLRTFSVLPPSLKIAPNYTFYLSHITLSTQNWSVIFSRNHTSTQARYQVYPLHSIERGHVWRLQFECLNPCSHLLCLREFLIEKHDELHFVLTSIAGAIPPSIPRRTSLLSLSDKNSFYLAQGSI